MFKVEITTHFAASHMLHGYEGACRALHGHTWKVETEVSTNTMDDTGISVDFKKLKEMTNSIISRFDHKHINDVPPFDTINPTAEHLAKYIYDNLEKMLPESVSMSRVTIWESEKYALTYTT